MGINPNLNPLPNSNPLGADGEGGTTGGNLGEVTTGGQNANVKQKSVIKGTEGVAQSEQGNVGESSLEVLEGLELNVAGAPDPSDPEIPPPREFKNPNQVNEWVTSTYLSHLSENYYAIAMLGKDIHKAEGKMSAMMMQKIWDTAVQTAALIMAKAQTEANMHLALAMSAMVGLAISIAGTAISIAGNVKSAAAKASKANLNADVPDAPSTPSTAKAGANPVAPQRPVAPAPDARPDNVPVTDQNVPNQPGPPRPARAAPVGRPANARPADVEPQAPVGKDAPADPVTAKEKYRQEKLAGKNLSAIGGGMQASANSVREIIDNIIQMIIKPMLAQYDGDIEKSRAIKEMASKALDSAMQAFNSGTDIVDGATRAFDKLSEVIKANSINSRG